MISIGLLSAFIATFAWSFYAIASKKSISYIGIRKLTIIATIAATVPMLLALIVTGILWPGIYQFALAAAAGVFMFSGLAFYFKAIESQQLTNVNALGEVQPAILILFGVFVLSESITALEVLAIILIFGGAFLMIRAQGLKINKKFVPALLSTISFTAYWLLMTESVSNTAGFVLQVTTSRIVALVLLLILFHFTSGPKKIGFKPKPDKSFINLILALCVVGGIIDGIGDTVFTFTVHSNIVAVGSAVTALGPIIVAILSYFIFKDRLTRTQGIGLMIMIIGALIISIW